MRVYVCDEQIAMHEPGDKIIVTDNGLAVTPGLHTLFDIEYTVVSTNNTLFFTGRQHSLLCRALY